MSYDFLQHKIGVIEEVALIDMTSVRSHTDQLTNQI